MKPSRPEYREELVRRAAEAAVAMLSTVEIKQRMPTVPTLELLMKAWLAGHKDAIDNRPETQR
jgi:hypothetical protein